jgi:uncharacterized membrane protein YhaH (DUF805 family)
MLGAIKYNLAHLLDFSGRDARQTFWFYVLFVFLVNMAIGFVMIIPLMGNLMGDLIAAGPIEDPAVLEALMADRMGEMMESMLWMGLGTTVLNAALLAAAFIRRLHDSNLSGWWGLLPLGLQLATSWYMTTRIDELKTLMVQMMSRTADPQAALAAQSQYTTQSLVGWVGIIAFVILGVRKSTEGPNRFAEAPVRF